MSMLATPSGCFDIPAFCASEHLVVVIPLLEVVFRGRRSFGTREIRLFEEALFLNVCVYVDISW